MSGRDASAAVLAEMVKGQVHVAHLFALLLDDGAAYNTDNAIDVEWDGSTYVANGHFMQFSSLEETADLQIARASFGLSVVDQTLIAAALSYRYIDRAIQVYKAFFDESSALIPDPVLIFDGRVDSAHVEDDPGTGASILTLTATSAWVDFTRRPGRHTNHQEQQLYFPGDRGFEYATVVNRQVVWGRK